VLFAQQWTSSKKEEVLAGVGMKKIAEMGLGLKKKMRRKEREKTSGYNS